MIKQVLKVTLVLGSINDNRSVLKRLYKRGLRRVHGNMGEKWLQNQGGKEPPNSWQSARIVIMMTTKEGIGPGSYLRLDALEEVH